jgi:DNA polymerase IV (DinB-like DNA polymerase)
MRDDPSLENQPVIIGADPKNGKGRGVVSTCNYIARKYGLHSAMPISIAFKKCPDGIYLRPNFIKYREASEQVMNIIKNNGDQFQQVSIDEAYIDVSQKFADYDHVLELAKSLQEQVKQKVGITMSIGISSTKSIAKIASDHKKPCGITLVRPEQVKEFLDRMDITRIPGIGKKSKEYYNKRSIHTIGDIIRMPLHKMIENFGNHGKWIWEIANGLDKREVKEFHESRKSISKERTFFEDIDDFQKILETIEGINSKIHDNLEKNNIYYRTITLKVRLEGFITYTRSRTMVSFIRNREKALNVILELFGEFKMLNKKVRLIGIRFSNLEKRSGSVQKNLLNYVGA